MGLWTSVHHVLGLLASRIKLPVCPSPLSPRLPACEGASGAARTWAQSPEGTLSLSACATSAYSQLQKYYLFLKIIILMKYSAEELAEIQICLVPAPADPALQIHVVLSSPFPGSYMLILAHQWSAWGTNLYLYSHTCIHTCTHMYTHTHTYT